MQPREQGKTGLLIVVLGPRSCEGCETDGGSLAVWDYNYTELEWMNMMNEMIIAKQVRPWICKQVHL